MEIVRRCGHGGGCRRGIRIESSEEFSFLNLEGNAEAQLRIAEIDGCVKLLITIGCLQQSHDSL